MAHRVSQAINVVWSLEQEESDRTTINDDLIALEFPGTFAGATVTFQVTRAFPPGQGTPKTVYNDATAYSVAVGADRMVHLASPLLRIVDLIIVSASAEAVDTTVVAYTDRRQ